MTCLLAVGETHHPELAPVTGVMMKQKTTIMNTRKITMIKIRMKMMMMTMIVLLKLVNRRQLGSDESHFWWQLYRCTLKNVWVHIAEYIAHCIVHIAEYISHCIVHISHCTVHIAEYISHCIVNIAQCAVHISEYIAQCTVHNVLSTLHTA